MGCETLTNFLQSGFPLSLVLSGGISLMIILLELLIQKRSSKILVLNVRMEEMIQKMARHL